VGSALDTVTARFDWPFLHNLIAKAAPVVPVAQVGTPAALYPAVFLFDWLKSAGTLTLIAAVFDALLLRVAPGEALRLYGSTLRALRAPAIAVVSVLSLAWVMNYSGMTVSLALLFTFTGPLFPFFAAFVGWIGVFLTGSDTASNNLFGGFQAIVAQQLGLSPILTAATNSAGGVTAKMISPQNLAIGSAAVGETGNEGAILREMIPWSLALVVAVGLIALAQAYVFPGVVPTVPTLAR
jgi:L-lactate permease